METYNIIVSILFSIIVILIFWGVYLYFSEEEKPKKEKCNLSIIKENKPKKNIKKKILFFLKKMIKKYLT